MKLYTYSPARQRHWAASQGRDVKGSPPSGTWGVGTWNARASRRPRGSRTTRQKACAITDHASTANTDSEEGMKAKPFDLQEIDCDRVECNAQPAASLVARFRHEH
jgi:hypothetical protein